MMIDHIGIYVDNLAKNDNFYRPLLKKIGYNVIFERPQCIAYGIERNLFLKFIQERQLLLPCILPFK